MNQGIYNKVYGAERYQQMKKEKTDIKLEYDFDNISLVGLKYRCGNYDDELDDFVHCEHDNRYLASNCMKKRIDELNSVCPKCEDNRMVKDCDTPFHRLPRVK